jgi:hypothetical protein
MRLTNDIAEALRWARLSLDRATSQLDQATIRRYMDTIRDQAGLNNND